MKTIEIKTATTEGHYKQAKQLIIEYVEWLGIDLSFQNFESEIDNLQTMYNTSDGGLYLAYLNDLPVGVIGLRRFEKNEAELKRMYIRPDSRGLGIGDMLIKECIREARELGYSKIKLDTASYMTSAINLYLKNGFTEIPAYRLNPNDSTKYFELDLMNDCIDL